MLTSKFLKDGKPLVRLSLPEDHVELQNYTSDRIVSVSLDSVTLGGKIEQWCQIFNTNQPKGNHGNNENHRDIFQDQQILLLLY